MNTGLDSWESVKVSLPPSPRARVKSGAGGPSGGGPGIVVSVASEVVVVVPASAELRAPDSDGVASEFEVDGVGARTAEVVVAADDDCSLTTSGSIALSEDTTEHEATTTARPARTRERRFMSDTVPQVLVNRTIS
jgi:hypothetical protein